MEIYHNNQKILDVAVDDNSYRYRAIKGEHNLTLYFSLAEHVEIPVGAYCVYENETYTLEKPESLTMRHSRHFEYTVVFDSPQAKAGKWKFRNPVDRRLKFTLTAKPIEHLQMFVDNMNQRDSGWTVGQCIDAPEKTISYNHAFCIDALTQMADECETEYEFVSKQVSLWKVEYNKDNPLPLSYGKGNGFRPGVGRSNFEDKSPIEILYVQGGERNIDPSKYGSSELLLPKNQTIRFDGVHFEDETDFDENKSRMYVTDADGFSIRRADKELFTRTEDSLDCSEIYPSRVGTVSEVAVKSEANHFYDFTDVDIPDNLNFEKCLIEGETMTVIFQSGMLAGKEFDVKYKHAKKLFEIVPQEIDGQTMPNDTFKPAVGDKYAVFHVALPDAYISDDVTKSGASWDMFREGVKYLYDNEEQKFTFTGELDGIWAKKDWLNIGGKIRLGGFVRFSDERFQPEGALVRIIGIKDYINNPHSPEIELSNSTVGQTVSSELKKIESNEVVMDNLHKEALQFAKRRFRDSQETIEMLKEAMLNNFTEAISPIAVQTMALLIGDKSLQFEFVNNMTNPTPVAHNVTYDTTTKVLTVPAGIIQHYTLGIDTISSSHNVSEYKFWSLPEFNTPPLIDGDKKYYMYAKVSQTDNTGMFYISEDAIGMDSVAGYYHLLMGILNSEYDGERSYVSLHGFTEVLPGQITTNRIATGDGKSFIDFLNNALHLGNGDSYLDWNNIASNTLSSINMLLENATIKNRLDVLGEALIAGFYFSNELIKSVASAGPAPAITLDGNSAKILLESLNTGGDLSLEQGVKSTISLDAKNGVVRASNRSGNSEKYAYISASGIATNSLNTNAYSESMPFDHKGGVVVIGSDNFDIDIGLGSEAAALTGVYGKVANSGTAPAYGGYFYDLMAAGLILRTILIHEDTTIGPYHAQCIGLAPRGTSYTVTLPSLPEGKLPLIGKTIFIKQVGGGSLRVFPPKGQILFDDSTPNEYYDVSDGEEIKVTQVPVQSGNYKYSWIVSMFR